MRFAPIFLLLAFEVSAQSGNFQKLSSADLKRFDIKSGAITYSLSGDAIGSESYKFDHWGWREQTSSQYTYTLYGVSSDEDRIDIRNGDFLYHANLRTNQGIKEKEVLTSSLLSYKETTEARHSYFLSLEGKQSEAENILGLPCEVWSFPKGVLRKIWIHKGITLKSERTVARLNITSTAVEVNFDEEIGASVFEINGISWTKKE